MPAKRGAVRTACTPSPHTATADMLLWLAGWPQMIEDLREQCNTFVAGSVVDVKVPRPYDPMLSDQYIGIANYGKVWAGGGGEGAFWRSLCARTPRERLQGGLATRRDGAG